MSSKPRLTADQILFVRTIVLRRRELQRQLRLVPTNEQLAEKLECSLRWIEKLSSPMRLKSPVLMLRSDVYADQSQTKNEPDAGSVAILSVSKTQPDEKLTMLESAAL